MPREAPTSSKDASALSGGRAALICALNKAAARGVRLTVTTSNGSVYRTAAPIIVCDRFLRFATPDSDKLVKIALEELVSLDVV